MVKLQRQLKGLIVLLLLVNAAACSMSQRYRVAVANQQLADAGTKMRDYIQGQYDLGQMPAEELDLWKKRLGKAGTIGRSMTDALMAGNDDVAQVQITAFLELLEDLERENIIKLTPVQQAYAYAILSTIRTTLNVVQLVAM